MRNVCSSLVGKIVRSLARLRGGGSALPGLVVERLDPGFMARVLHKLPYGVVIISGTNGKTTTTKMVVEMLQTQGFTVFTNKTGSNFSRGIVAAIVQQCTLRGRLAADIAVLELDEAHAIHVINRVPPRYTLLLNVLRDQLDRFGEIDTTAKLLQRIADATKEGLVVNREDRLTHTIGIRTRQRALTHPDNPPHPKVVEFGLSKTLTSMFPSDDDFHATANKATDTHNTHTPGHADVVLTDIEDHAAVFHIEGVDYRTPLALQGLYNTYNAAAALSLVRLVLDGGPEHKTTTTLQHDKPSTPQLLEALSAVRPAFGRGEQLTLDAQPLELVLVKNPAGFRIGLASFNPRSVAVMIAINDDYADGRDMSWLWDVDFTSLQKEGVHTVSGTRAWDMALRLEHDDVPIVHVTEPLGEALDEFRQHTMNQARRIYCTYTAMLKLRKTLAELTEVEEVW